jgi:hypothetical protein
MSTPWQPPPVYPPGPPAYAPAQPETSTPPGTPSDVRRPGGAGARRAGMVAAVAAIVFGAGLAGVIVGTRIGGATPGTSAAESIPPSASPPPPPTAAQVRAETVDLCTRFAAGYAAMPTPQNNAADVVPAANYIGDALRDNANADSGVRSTVTASLRLFRAHAAALSREPAKGAVQPPTDWTAAAANAADDAVWSACNGYQG